MLKHQKGHIYFGPEIAKAKDMSKNATFVANKHGFGGTFWPLRLSRKYRLLSRLMGPGITDRAR